MFKKILISLGVILSLPSLIFADEFFPSGDSDLNRYYDAIGYTIGNIPISQECAGCIEYDQNMVLGESTQEVLNSVDITGVTTKDPRYGLIRTLNVMDRVSIPPQSGIDFIYWAQNDDSSVINISNIKMFLSRYYPSSGNLLNLLNMSATYQEIPLKYMIWNYPRAGYIKEYAGLGMVSANSILNPFILDSAQVKTPLQFIDWSANVDGNFAQINLKVKNNSQYVLNNVVFRHNEFTQAKNFEVGEEYIFKYTVAYNSSNSLGYVSLTDPNTHKECIALGEHLASNTVGESVVVSAQRNSGELFANVIGSRVKPFGDAFCITQIPYTVYSQEMFLTTNSEELKEDLDSVVAPAQEDLPEILGITKLPQTGTLHTTYIFSFLVGISFLWYYLKRRF